MTSKIIYTIFAPEVKGKQNDMWKSASKIIEVQQAYATSVGADYKCIEFESGIDYNELQFKKLEYLDTFSNYDQILYLDFDVLPHKHAENIFEREYELALMPLIRTNCDKSALKRVVLAMEKLEKKGKDIIFNTGVVAAQGQYIKKLNLIDKMKEFRSMAYWMTDDINNEAFITWAVEKYDIEWDYLSTSWNWILDPGDTMPTAFPINFIHFSNKEFDFSLTSLDENSKSQ